MLKTLQEKLSQHRDSGLWRSHRVRTGPQSCHMNFNSNDYLGMSNHPQVIEAFKKAADRYGVGAGSANTLSGYTQAHDELRQTLREWLGRDDVLLFSSGYQANIAVLTTLIGSDDHIFADKLNHASLNDGMRFCGAKFTRYKHLQIPRRVEECLDRQKWLITESIFSMDGDQPDFQQIAALSDDTRIIIDEAHSLGLYGPQGAGLIAENNLTQKQVPIMIGTFGKSIGTQGAFVAGEQTYIDALMQFARPYLFTTAMAPALAAASNAAIQLVRESDSARDHICSLVQAFRARAKTLNLSVTDSSSPIQAILFDDINVVNRVSERLNQQGIAISSIRYPTVAINEPRLRLSLTAHHTPAMLDQFFDILKEALDEEASHASRL